MDTIKEPKKEIPVTAEYGVVIVGGGIAGVAAAVAASRHNCKTLLIEKAYGLGGLATLGIVTTFLPICDGRGNKVISGICEEMLLLSEKGIKDNNHQIGLRKAPESWKKDTTKEERTKERYLTCFSPAEYQIILEEYLADNNVDLYYDTRFCDCIKNDGRISHIIVENKDGRQAIKADAFVDCSGDADLCFAAGEKTFSLDSNVLCGWHFTTRNGQLQLNQFSKGFDHEMTREGSEGPFFSGDNAEDNTQMVLQSRQLFKQQIEDMRSKNPDDNFHIFSIPSIPCFRATRRLDTDFVLDMEHCGKWFDDAVAMTGDWRRNGPVYSIPLRCLNGQIPNLFTAGRCISAQKGAWDITRSIPTCGVTGQASGTAAALISSKNTCDIKELQEMLISDGMLLSPDLLGK